MIDEYIRVSKHAAIRAQQRGLTAQDIGLILEIGTEIDDEAVELRDIDVQHAIERCKHQIQRLEHLRGRRLIISGETLVTCYHATRRRRFARR